MWNLENSEKDKRVYRNDTTGSECTMSRVYNDREGNSWWLFDNLIMMPFTRNFAAMKVAGLYRQGFSKDDLTGHVQSMKEILKSNDAEKYEKAYSKVIEFESMIDASSNAVKQMSALVCVYFTMNDEPIDAFIDDTQKKKLSLLEADPEMHAFFLNLQIDAIERYSQALNQVSQIASPTNRW